MRLGIFDSGMGGLLIARSVLEQIPNINMTYLGDTLHVPYGARSTEAIYHYTECAIDFLFSEQDCELIVIACNTASAAALRKIQQDYLPKKYPNRRVLGVVVPTLEAAAAAQIKKIGLIATKYTLASGIYQDELFKIDPRIELVTNAAPLLVPLIENNGEPWLYDILQTYIEPLRRQNIDGLILGCTHYSYVRDLAQNILGPNIPILAQTEIIPAKLDLYLKRHPEIADRISRDGNRRFFLTEVTDSYAQMSERIYGQAIDFQKADIKT